MRKARFAARVKKVLMRNAETKYFDIGKEDQQLYHNTGIAGTAYVCPVVSNPWQLINNGSYRYNRIGDVIQPRGMKVNIWMSNKEDRPNVQYRIVVAIFPKTYGGSAVTPGSIDPAPSMQNGALGNYLILPFDKEKGIKVLYDRIVRNNWNSNTSLTNAAAFTPKEMSCTKTLYIRRKRSANIVYEPAGAITNKPLYIFVIPYDAKGTLTSDRIASCAVFTRLYWKDV